MEKLKEYFPILEWGPNYKKEYALRDLIAGFTVAVTIVPQGLAYATLAQLPAEYGLYTSYMAAIIYTFLGSSKDLSVGPQSLMSLLTAEYCVRPSNWVPLQAASEKVSDPRLAILLCLCSGCIILFLGIFNLGGIVNFISHPVLVGFISAASVVIPLGLLSNVFGLFDLPRSFIPKMIEMGKRLGESRYLDAILGFSTIATLMVLKHAKIRFANVHKDDHIIKVAAKKCLWFVATLRNAFVLFATSIILYKSGNNCPFEDDASIRNLSASELQSCITPMTISAITLPVPSFPDTNITQTDGESAGLQEMISQLGSGIIIVPFVSILQSVGIGKSLSERGNYKVNARNDFFAIGIGSIASAFVQAMPVSGCFSRSSLHYESNTATQLTNIVTAAGVLISALLFAEYFSWIPNAALSAVLIAAVSSMFDIDAIMEVWTLSKKDALPMMTTFLLSVYDFRVGIVAGILLNLGMLLYNQNSPDIEVDRSVTGAIKITLEHGIAFPVCENLLDTFHNAVEVEPTPDILIIDLKHAYTADVSAARTLKKMSRRCNELDMRLKIINVNDFLNEMLKKLDVTIYENSKEGRRGRSMTKEIELGFENSKLLSENLLDSMILADSMTQIHFK